MESLVQLPEGEMEKAVSLEKNKQPKEAARLYEMLLRQHPGNKHFLTRLMINYRTLKDYKKELKHINALIKLEQGFYAPQKKKGESVISISEKLNKLLGATDKKGNKIYTDDTIKKLEKRKLLVEKKLGLAN